jgi:hypothetical protein
MLDELNKSCCMQDGVNVCDGVGDVPCNSECVRGSGRQGVQLNPLRVFSRISTPPV